MSKISNVDQLMNFMLSTIQKFEDKKINYRDAQTASMLCENVLNVVKTQILYSRMRGKPQEIEFMNDDGKMIESN